MHLETSEYFSSIRCGVIEEAGWHKINGYRPKKDYPVVVNSSTPEEQPIEGQLVRQKIKGKYYGGKI